MKKLLIASSVMAALTMGVAHADPLTLNGGTVEFIGEITDTTCWAGVDGTSTAGASGNGTAGPSSAGNLVLLPVVPISQFLAIGDTAGRTKFTIAVRGDIVSGANACTLGNISDRDDNNIPKLTSHPVDKVKAIFGGTLTAADQDIYNNPNNGYNAGNLNNVDMATGYLNNIANVATANGLRNFDPTLNTNAGMNGSAEGVQLRLLNEDYSIIKVGDAASQMTDSNSTPITGTGTGTNTSSALTTGTNGKALLPYYVEYIRTGSTVKAGMVRSFVVYDLYYQ